MTKEHNAMMPDSLKLQLHNLGVETESQTIELIGSILHTLSTEAKISVLNLAASHLKITPTIENQDSQNDLPH
jgi:hypothetical protein